MGTHHKTKKPDPHESSALLEGAPAFATDRLEEAHSMHEDAVGEASQVASCEGEPLVVTGVGM